MLRKTFENGGRDFLYGDTKLVAAMEGIGKFFFFSSLYRQVGREGCMNAFVRQNFCLK